MQNAATSLEQDSGSSDAVAKVVFKAVTSENPILMYLAETDRDNQLGDHLFPTRYYQRYFCV